MSLAGKALVRRVKLLEGSLNRSTRLSDEDLARLELVLVAVLELVRLYRKTRRG